MVDSTLASPTVAAEDAPAPRPLGISPLLWLRRWRAQAAGRARQTAQQRTRRMALDGTRLLLLALSSGLLAGAAACLQVWWQQRLAVQTTAAATLAFVNSRLYDIEQEMRFLAPPAGEPPCSDPQVATLLRASLASTLVRHFVQGQAGQDFACGPEGRVPVFELAGSAGPGLVLTSSGQISARLVLRKAGPGALVTQAELDPRALEQSAASVPLAAVAQRVSLLSAAGHRLAVLRSPGDSGPAPAAEKALLWASEPSADNAWSVLVEVDAPALLARFFRQMALAVLAAWLLVAALAGTVWRRAVLRARLRHRIAQGLRRRQFEPHVQPIVDLASGRCVGGEVLMRWHHPQRGVLTPAEFIEEAERTGFIVPMSDLVMSRAAQRLAQLARLQPEMYFSFNVTPLQLRQPGFATRLAEIFNAETLTRAQVLLELTEREFVDPQASHALESLRRDGWRVAIDDFGTGQSSLASLEMLHIDRIKIDRAFVRTIDEHTIKRPVLDAIIALAGQLGVHLIAEGVETQSQWDYLRQRGVQYAQGYLFAKPMGIDAFARWLWQAPVATSSLHAPHPATALATPADALLIDAQAQQLWQRLRTAGGLDVRTRLHGLRAYADCFIGREAVDWLVRHQRLPRDQAVRLGQRLMALGLMSHVLDEHDFKDDELFYRLAAAPGGQATDDAVAQGLALALRGPAGPAWQSHTQGLLLHRRCSSGRALIDWIVQQHPVPRSTALQWAGQLMRQGVLRHVFDDQPLRDDRTLYRLA